MEETGTIPPTGGMEVEGGGGGVCIICCKNMESPSTTSGIKISDDGIDKEGGDEGAKEETSPPPTTEAGGMDKFVRQVVRELEGMEVKNRLEEVDMKVLDKLPVCKECGEVVRGTVEKKGDVEESEGKVKRLEDELREEMQRLEGRLKEYYVEMKRIEGIVRGSDVDRLEAALKGKSEEMKSKMEDGVVAEKVGVEGVEEESRNHFSLVNMLRDSIFMVVRELDDKHGDPPEPQDGRRKSRRLRKKTRKRYLDAAVEDASEFMTPLLHCTVKMEGQAGGIDPSMAASMTIPEFEMVQLIKEEPLEEETATEDVKEAGGDTVIEQMECLEGEVPVARRVEVIAEEDDDGFEPEVINEVIVVGGQGHRGRPRRKRKQSGTGGDGGEEVEVEEEEIGELEDMDPLETSDDDFFLDEGEEDLGSESESTSSSSGEEDLEEDNSSDGEEYGRRKGKAAKSRKVGRPKKDVKTANPNSKKSRKEAYTRALDSINFSRMSKPKRKLIQRILHKKYRRPTRKPKTPGKESVDDPRTQHFIEYDPITSSLSLDGIQIKIHEEPNPDDSSQEPILILECGACGYFARPASNSRHPVDSFIYNHIAGQHLNLFQCVQCGSNLGGYKQYSDHVLGHRMGFACDVCGRPLGGAQALARHKWSHLNDLEASQLVSKGLKDPREKKESTKIYPCATCHKIFPQRCQLKKHEKVHAQVRERITCEICGKLFLPSGFISHKRYYCFPEGVEQPRISCPLCPKVFKNKQFMQVHMDRAHNDARNHKCVQCGKGFKTKKDLMTHEETHTTERAFSCKKGCGRAYKTRKNCNAHEKRCDGRGGVLIQRFLDAGEERPFGCRKGCGRAYKTRRTLRGHEKTCNGSPFVAEVPPLTTIPPVPSMVAPATVVTSQISSMTVLGQALQASMEAVMGVVVGGGTTVGVIHQATAPGHIVEEHVPEAVATETVITKVEYE